MSEAVGPQACSLCLLASTFAPTVSSCAFTRLQVVSLPELDLSLLDSAFLYKLLVLGVSSWWYKTDLGTNVPLVSRTYY